MFCIVEVFHGKVSTKLVRDEDKTLDVGCCLVLLVEGSPAAELKFLSVEGLGTVITEGWVDDLSCIVTDTICDGFCVVSTDVSETPELTMKGNEEDACANV